ncbi:ATP-binding protein [Sphaerospermopsis sp. LEGE 08334]|uniref:sensor histidine kinase n=1 Tax=Sphaerospermopsis sp. LEGE 08334 TaxID=1828651 RepID=UPI00187FA25B|nr:ATP-binding protein [Sphaerospermopsis sp. LEGE 08334]MBE9054992.1 GAF domain-containing protein [Sphaerospermopsis sp. LEGE 08334]
MNQINQNNIISNLQVDLTSCDREPIHIPGCIQSHGVLLALKEPELTIVQISDNTFKLLGMHPHELLNQTLDKLLDNEQIHLLSDCLGQENLQFSNFLEFSIQVGNKLVDFDVIIYRCQGIIILELEPNLLEKSHKFFNFYPLIKLTISQLKNATNVTHLSQILAQEVRRITGFDRVMVYRFDENWNGRVIAEAKLENLTAYLDLHYPATDIPQQARKLYTQNWLRLIPDVNYQSAAIIPTNNPLTEQPLDLSNAVLRSVSPIHIEYMKNMGVTASMSISIIKNQTLWGLIACHHQSPKYIPYEIRNACEFLGHITSIELGAKEDSEDTEYKLQLKSIHSKLVEYMSRETNFIAGLTNYQPNLLELVNATGAAVYFDGEYITIGNTPEQLDIQNLIRWINHNLHEEIFATNELAKIYPAAEKFRDVASGLLVISIAKSQKNYVLWFRPEVLQTVAWGGNPHKAVELNENGDMRLSPRKSFDLWKETVRLKSLPWKSCEINAALDLRNAIIGVVLRKVDELAQLNMELERSNSELDAFAYIASHDLKEPLRGIHNYSNFLIEDYGDILNENGRAKLQTLVRLTQRMEDLIDSLLHFSRLGRVDLSMQQTDLNQVIHRILDLLSPRIEETGIEIRIPQPLPTVYCDRIQVGEVFSNLIANAIKYNDKAEKWIEIGYIYRNETLILYVKDNGIGIREKHFDAIFRIFKRLHGPNKFGGGTGAGLTIAKKIVERHSGKIWVESSYGEGSTFYFTLAGSGI